MGWVYGHQLEPAGKYLLSVLKSEQPVPFSRFYDDDTDYALLAKGVASYAGEDRKIDEDHVHILIEYAAEQLAAADLVTFTKLDARLIDGEEDFEITLTENGRAMIEAGNQFHFRDMDL